MYSQGDFKFLQQSFPSSKILELGKVFLVLEMLNFFHLRFVLEFL